MQPLMSYVNKCPTSWTSYFTSLSLFAHMRINLRLNEMKGTYLMKSLIHVIIIINPFALG